MAARTLFIAQPPFPWQVRPRLVVDASIVAASVFAEPAHDQAEAQMAGHALCAPSLIDYEIANVALNKLRGKTLSVEDLQHALDVYAEFVMDHFDVEVAPVIRIGETLGLSVYDASYVWLAGHLRVPIATFDRRVATAAAAYLKQLPPS